MQKAITFHNFTSKDFSWKWDGATYTFRPGVTYMMEDWKARHFAKHLANHVLNTMEKSVSDPLHAELVKKALPDDGATIEAVDASKLTTEIMNHATPEAAPKKNKGGRPAKAKASAPSDEETFEGLKS